MNKQEKYHIVEDGEFSYKFVQGGRTNKRVNGFWTKEPQTLEWIRGFRRDSVFLDIGSNIGQYALYAGKRVREVYAVEPHIPTTSLLLQNVELNRAENVHVITSPAYWCCETVDFHYRSLVQGSSGSEIYGNMSDCPDWFLSEKKYAFTIDFMVGSCLIEKPTYVKIDVDNREHDVLRGMSKLFEENPPISLMVEYNPGTGEQCTELLESLGYKTTICHTATSKEKTDKGAYLEETPHNRLYTKC